MRVTNQMVTGNSLRNMQKSFSKVNNLTQQSTTGKKIQTPSEDPVIAIRALKLRTTVEQLDQYKNKNIPDALSWMDTTQTSVQQIVDRLEDIYDYCVQGSTDSFSTDDRNTIINNLLAIKEAIYAEGGRSYAGRYLFTGYKTETNLIFQDEESKKGLSYLITENFTPNDISVKNVVVNPIDVPESLADMATLLGGGYTNPKENSVYKMRLSYDNIDPNSMLAPAAINIAATDAGGNAIALPTPTIKELTDADTYEVADGEIVFIPETGELLFGKDIYNTLSTAENISVEYCKKDFAVGDLRPEMYFDCTRYYDKSDPYNPYANPNATEIDFTIDPAGQEIQYEVNFNQKITVNVEGKDVIKHSMGNLIQDLADMVQSVLDIEEKIAKLNTLLQDPQYNDTATYPNGEAVNQLKTMIEDAGVELAMRREHMQKFFGNNITKFQNFGEEVGAIQAKLGTTYSKLEMIEERVIEQYANFKELKSINEDVEADEVAIDLYSARIVYESSLMTTAGIMQKTLLDYL